MSISFEGIGEVVATFLNDKSNVVFGGCPCKVTASGTVGNCSAGERFSGVVARATYDSVAVQLSGYVNTYYNGTAPTVGWNSLVSNGFGGVKLDTEGVGGEYLVVDVDTANKLVGFML